MALNDNILNGIPFPGTINDRLSEASKRQVYVSSISDITYDGSNRVTGYTINGISYTVTYTGTSKVSTIVGGGRTLTYNYDGSDRITSVVVS